MTPARLRRWVGGYTYWLREATDSRVKRQRPPVIKTDLPVIDRTIALSFLELMELRVVKAIVDSGVTLQHVRAAAELAADYFRTDHPFASRRVFTDGKAIFSAITEDATAPDIVKWSAKEIEQIISGVVFANFLHEIEFDERTSFAYRWWPLGRHEPVVLDPRVSFGAPVIEGTAVRTAVVARLASYLSPEDAAVAYELEMRQVQSAVRFEDQLLAA